MYVEKVYKDEMDNKDPYCACRIVGLDLRDDTFEKIYAIRKEYSTLHQELKAFQKQCGKNKDIEGARFFSEECKHAFKMYKAACYILGTLRPDVYGDCPLPERKEIPLEYDQPLRTALALIN